MSNIQRIPAIQYRALIRAYPEIVATVHTMGSEYDEKGRDAYALDIPGVSTFITVPKGTELPEVCTAYQA